ncbi:hypothetical protein PTTG_25265 [Puccinia triticina 1-1 BBBD Race 1]|uniref:Uncharacterized protein n=1 Tax=Puccinia triticina (isolate 1-1 / race 1 (BBBD)) TaxID=630390 RepID=A0A180H3Z6_PUCT1|nr:hypothetical protein PTTG_25265 [Puccinia triticina 1-1 BBBD Race 1]
MSRLGIDLFGREHPPPGYHSASKLYQICGISSPPAVLTPQVIDCSTSFWLFYPKSARTSAENTYRMIKSAKKFMIQVSATSTLEEFYKTVAQACDKQFDGAAQLICDALETGYPPMDWKISMNLPAANEFKTISDYRVKDVATFTHWMATVLSNGKDHTKASLDLAMVNPEVVAKEAKAVVEVKRHLVTQKAASNGLLLDSGRSIKEGFARRFQCNQCDCQSNFCRPPTEPEWAQAIMLSTRKKRKLSDNSSIQIDSLAVDSDTSLVVNLEENLLDKYLEFVKIPVREREGIVSIRVDNKATNPKIFRSKNITREIMKGWGLHDVFIAQLRDHVQKFEKSKSSQ